ncbi:hypothetical protein M885DRAFT_512671 [Pelagophyceae sp. CCMP2097]|nr:hypothetical protein M885DRAFT_512671 [Pelagophyceae sp. CCMP2097]
MPRIERLQAELQIAWATASEAEERRESTSHASVDSSPVIGDAVAEELRAAERRQARLEDGLLEALHPKHRLTAEAHADATGDVAMLEHQLKEQHSRQVAFARSVGEAAAKADFELDESKAQLLKARGDLKTARLRVAELERFSARPPLPVQPPSPSIQARSLELSQTNVARLQRVMTEAVDKARRLEGKLEASSRAAKDLEGEVAALQKRCKDAEAGLPKDASKDARTAAPRDSDAALQTRLKQAETALAAANKLVDGERKGRAAAFKESETAAAALRTRLAAAEADAASANSKNAKRGESDKAADKAAAADSEQRATALDKRCRDLEAQCRELLQSSRDSATMIQAELDGAVQQLADERSKVLQLKADVARRDVALQDDRGRAALVDDAAERDVERRRSAATQEELAVARARADKAEREGRATKDSLERSHAESEAQIDRVSASLARERERVLVVEARAVTAEAHVATLEATISTLEQELGDQKANPAAPRAAAQAKGKATSAASRFRAKFATDSDASADSDDSAAAPQALGGDSARLRVELERERSRAAAARTSFEAAKMDFETTSDALRDELATERDTALALRDEADRLREAGAEARAKMDALQRRCDAANARAHDAESKLESRSERLSQLRDKVGGARLSNEADSAMVLSKQAQETDLQRWRADDVSAELAQAKLKLAEMSLEADSRGGGKPNPDGGLAHKLKEATRRNAELSEQLERTRVKEDEDDLADELAEAKLVIAELTFERDSMRGAKVVPGDEPVKASFWSKSKK